MFEYLGEGEMPFKIWKKGAAERRTNVASHQVVAFQNQQRIAM